MAGIYDLFAFGTHPALYNGNLLMLKNVGHSGSVCRLCLWTRYRFGILHQAGSVGGGDPSLFASLLEIRGF